MTITRGRIHEEEREGGVLLLPNLPTSDNTASWGTKRGGARIFVCRPVQEEGGTGVPCYDLGEGSKLGRGECKRKRSGEVGCSSMIVLMIMTMFPRLLYYAARRASFSVIMADMVGQSQGRRFGQSGEWVNATILLSLGQLGGWEKGTIQLCLDQWEEPGNATFRVCLDQSGWDSNLGILEIMS
eukprot:scaffold3044_cov103-Cylindrotheca_fusiformis.AAC.1